MPNPFVVLQKYLWLVAVFSVMRGNIYDEKTVSLMSHQISLAVSPEIFFSSFYYKKCISPVRKTSRKCHKSESCIHFPVASSDTQTKGTFTKSTESTPFCILRFACIQGGFVCFYLEHKCDPINTFCDGKEVTHVLLYLSIKLITITCHLGKGRFSALIHWYSISKYFNWTE